MRIILYSIFVLLIFSCRTNNSNDSDTKYGFLENRIKSGKVALIRLEPFSKILVCGPRHQRLYKAVIEWAKTVRRNKYLTIDKNASCKSYKNYEAVVAGSEDRGEKLCLRGSIAFSTFGYKNKLGTRVNFCKDEISQSDILHEVGHGWGMCDQYDGTDKNNFVNNVHHPRCGSLFRDVNNQEDNQVMSASQDLPSLTPRDILGLRIMACRGDITRKDRKWYDFFDWFSTKTEVNKKWAHYNRYFMRDWEGLFDEVERLDRIIGGRNFLKQCYRDYDPSE